MAEALERAADDSGCAAIGRCSSASTSSSRSRRSSGTSATPHSRSPSASDSRRVRRGSRSPGGNTSPDALFDAARRIARGRGRRRRDRRRRGDDAACVARREGHDARRGPSRTMTCQPPSSTSNDAGAARPRPSEQGLACRCTPTRCSSTRAAARAAGRRTNTSAPRRARGADFERGRGDQPYAWIPRAAERDTPSPPSVSATGWSRSPTRSC